MESLYLIVGICIFGFLSVIYDNYKENERKNAELDEITRRLKEQRKNNKGLESLSDFLEEYKTKIPKKNIDEQESRKITFKNISDDLVRYNAERLDNMLREGKHEEVVKSRYRPNSSKWRNFDLNNIANYDYMFDNYKIHYLYHMTHIDNLRGIFENGLLSHDNNLAKTRIDNREVNARREKREPVYGKNLHSYVPFYFRPKNAMLFVRKEHQENIVILAFDRRLMLSAGAIYTDGNAATQRAIFYKDVQYLGNLHWDCLDARYWQDFEDGKNRKMAEALIPNIVEPEYIDKIICYNEAIKERVAQMNDAVKVEVNKNFYF